MRLNRSILLTAVALLASTDATAMSTDTEQNKLSPHNLAAASNRFLRAAEHDEKIDGEERDTAGISAMFSSALTSNGDDMAQKLLSLFLKPKTGISTQKLSFDSLKLDNGLKLEQQNFAAASAYLEKIPEGKLVDALKQNPALKEIQVKLWLQADKSLDDVKIALGLKMVKAIDNPDIKFAYTLMKNFEGQRQQFWLSHLKTPDEVKAILKLDQLGNNMRDSPDLSASLKFTRAYNEREQLPELSSISEMLEKIPADQLGRVLKNNPGLENLQYKYWIRMNKTPDEVKKARPGLESTLYDDFAAMFKQQQTKEYWLSTSKTPDEVKEILGINRRRQNLFDGPNLGVWIQFTRAYNKQQNLPALSSMDDILKASSTSRKVPQLLKKFSGLDDSLVQHWILSSKSLDDVELIFSRSREGFDKVAKMYKSYRGDADFWLRSKKSPRDVQTILGLTKSGVFEKEYVDVWMKFTRAYNNKNRLPDLSSMDEFLKAVPEKEVFDVLTKPGLERMQFRLWREQGKPHKDVLTVLNSGRISPDAARLAMWKRYYNLVMPKSKPKPVG